MAGLTGTDRGSGSRNTGGESTYVITPGSNFAAGSRAVLSVAYDNSGTLGADPYSGIVDSLGNTWAVDDAVLNDPGAANAGICLRVFSAVMTTPLTTADTITVSFGGITTVARAYTLSEITPETGATSSVLFGTSETTGSSTTPSVTRTSAGTLASAVLIGSMGAAGNAAITGDSDSTNGAWSTQQTSGVGVGAAGAEVSSQRKVLTAAGNQTYNLTITSAVWAIALTIYQELTNAAGGNAAGTGAAYGPTPNVGPNPGNAAGTGTAYNATVTAVEYQRPISDIAAGSWTVAPLWSKVDEVVIDDADLITSETLVSPGNTSNADLRLGARGDPVSSTGQIISVRAKVTFTLGLNGGIRGELRQGSGVSSTLIGTLTTDALTTSFVTYTYTLSGAEADSITDYGDLFLRLYGNFPVGSLGGVTVSWVQFQQPAGVVPVTSVYPDTATGTGAAGSAAANIAPNAALAAGTGAAGNATTSISGTSGAATGTGAAGAPTPSIAPNAGVAAGTGAAGAPSTSVQGTGGASTGTGAAGSPAAALSVNAALAAGTGTAGDTAGSAAGSSGAATGTGAAGDPSAALSTQSGVAAGTGTANAGSSAIAATGGIALGVGTAYDATVTAAVTAIAGVALGVGTAYDATVTVGASGGVANGVGVAYNPGVSVLTPPLLVRIVTGVTRRGLLASVTHHKALAAGTTGGVLVAASAGGKVAAGTHPTGTLTVGIE